MGRNHELERYIQDGLFDCRIIGSLADTICSALLENHLASDLNHAHYVGREVQTEELALHVRLTYHQDRILETPSGQPTRAEFAIWLGPWTQRSKSTCVNKTPYSLNRVSDTSNHSANNNYGR